MRQLCPLLAVFAFACTPPADQEEGWSVKGYETDWTLCSLEEGADDNLAHCTDITVPLAWGEPDDDRTIVVRAKRLRGDDDSDVQLWLLAGGPGGSGLYGHHRTMLQMREAYPKADIFTLDHRGTGYTERLGCSAEDEGSEQGSSITEGEIDGCLAELDSQVGDRMGFYTTTQSSYDLAALIEAERQDDMRVMVWGGSYGSYWAQRYLAVQPDGADGVIIEGIVPADGTFIVSEEWVDRAAHDVFDLCGQDAFCKGKLGDDPWGYLDGVLNKMRLGHCQDGGLRASTLSTMFAYLMYHRAGMSVLPAAAWRADRCSAADEAALMQLYNSLFGAGGSWDLAQYSILLQHHVTYGEMWDHPDFDGVDLDIMYEELYNQTLVVKGYGHYKVDMAERWPAYSDPAWDDRWAQTDTPLLMLQGELDPVTPHGLAIAVRDHFDGANQTYVSFPYSAHSASSDSPTGTDGQGSRCGLDIYVDFLGDPTGEVDTACVADVTPINFEGTPGYANHFFGTDDYWE